MRDFFFSPFCVNIICLISVTPCLERLSSNSSRLVSDSSWDLTTPLQEFIVLWVETLMGQAANVSSLMRSEACCSLWTSVRRAPDLNFFTFTTLPTVESIAFSISNGVSLFNNFSSSFGSMTRNFEVALAGDGEEM